MNHILKRHWFKAVVSLLVILIVGIVTLQVISARSTLPVEGQAPNYTLQDASGKTVHFTDSSGKVRLLTFFYTSCPDECPLTAGKMEQLQNELTKKGLFGSKVVFDSITFDPKTDTSEKLNYYATKFHANPAGWEFLRGTQEQTNQVISGFGVPVLKDPDSELYEHSMKTYLIDGSGNIRKTYGLSEDLNVNDMIADMENLIKH